MDKNKLNNVHYDAICDKCGAGISWRESYCPECGAPQALVCRDAENIKSGFRLRLAGEEDSAAILKIYEPFITDTAITFEYKVPDLSEFRDRIRNIQKKYPWIVCEADGYIVGYAYASEFSKREAYDWSVDLSVYIDTEYHGKKIGRILYTCLIEILRLQGYFNAYAGVTMPNDKSEGLHRTLGFKTIGIYEKAGNKFGKWHDLKRFGLRINDHSDSPGKPKSIEEVKATIEFESIIKKAGEMTD